MELIVLAVVAGLSFASYALWRQARAGAQLRELEAPDGKQLEAHERTIHELVPGDVVSHLDTDWLVEGLVHFADDGRAIRLYRMIDGGKERWLAAHPGDEAPWLLDEAPALTVEANGPESIDFRGVPYRLAARASTMAQATGQVGTGRDGGRVQVYSYLGAGPSRVLALAWAGRTEAFAGEQLEPGTVEILPGGG